MNELLIELQNYLTDNFISFKTLKNKENTLQINGETYELFSVNEDGRFFDESFYWDNDKTGEDNYIFCFGSVWYSLKRGNEKSVKLERVKWLGKVSVGEEALLQENFLGIHGPFELMNGMGSYKEWCKKAKFLGIKTLGLCEKGTLAGTLKFQTACQKEDLRSILGMEVPIQINSSDLRYSIKAFVKDEIGWRNLLWLNKIINVDGEGFVTEKDLKDCSEGLVFIYDPKTIDFNQLPSEVWLKDRAYFQLDTVVYEKEERDEFYLKNLKRFFGTKMKPVLMSDAYVLEKEYTPIRSKLNRISNTMNYESENQYFKNGEEFWNELTSLFNENDFDRLYETFLEASQNLNDICNSCNFSIDTSQRHLPKYYMTPEEEKRFSSNEEMFRELVYEGVETHPDLLENFDFDMIAERIEREIDVIEDGGVVDYFLILRDIVNWCKQEGILVGPGRGSGSGSLCNYLLNITRVNPLQYNLLFERFINLGRLVRNEKKEIVIINSESQSPVELDSLKYYRIFRNDKELVIKGSELKIGDKLIEHEG